MNLGTLSEGAMHFADFTASDAQNLLITQSARHFELTSGNRGDDFLP